MENQSLQIYISSLEASQKFDYFVSGLTGALLAYIAQGLHPGVLTFGPSLLEPLAVLLLSASFIFGMNRIETTIRVVQAHHTAARSAEISDEVSKIVAPAVEAETGYSFDDESQRNSYLANIRKRRVEAEVSAREKMQEAVKWYNLRQIFLYCGFAVLVLHRFVSPYGPWHK